VKPRVKLAVAAGAVALAIGGAFAALYRPFPSDHTPEGAYMRIARSVADNRMSDAFPYLETEAQWACYTIRDMRKGARDRASAAFPEPERSRLVASYRAEADAADGKDVFALEAERRGWRARLRRDMSGAVATEITGERATVITAQGTRYSFRRRENGIWGLTMFTADLLAESERATRDRAMIEAAAADYTRAKN
jgi:archaeosine-15-forming tRNA-guanine transglycosylase